MAPYCCGFCCRSFSI